MASSNKQVLIVGAGPVGLAAGLFLVKQCGVKARIIEKTLKRVEYSKALGVNARSLELLESTGATEMFLNNGVKMRSLNIYKNYNLIVKNSLAESNAKYPFMLAQPQADSEQIFTELLEKDGVKIERGIELIKLTQFDENVRVELKHHDDCNVETADFDIVFAADGAHSAVRKQLNLKFIGNKYEEPWYLCDAKLTSDLSENEVHEFFFGDSFLFLAHVKNNIWRFASNSSNFMDKIPSGINIESITWKSEFYVCHRIIERFSAGNVYFGGDAAHVHSPVGGRGMNLGIEDAYVFAKLFNENRLNEYHNQRYQIVEPLVKRIEYISNMVNGKSFFSKLFQMVAPYILPVVAPFTLNYIQKYVLGMDHDIENLK